MILDTPAWKNLAAHVADIRATHLRDLMRDGARCAGLVCEHDGVVIDFSRQNVTACTMELLFDLARAAGLERKIAAMASGEKINTTENRAVLHMALRAPPAKGAPSSRNARLRVDGADVNAQVHEVLKRIKTFSDQVRSGTWKGATGKPLTDVVAIGIGGSYLGPEFVFEALRTDPACARAADGRRLRFLANVDPIDVARALEGLDPARTLVVVVSKTFTTAETMLNARTVRAWLVKKLGAKAVAKHMVAVSTNLPEVEAFGIDPRNAFGFWDWVGGRYSVCSAVGILPLSLQYGFPRLAEFLAGAHAIDRHVTSAPPERNLPVILGLLGIWNASFLGHGTRALLPYCQALLKFAPHIQQVDMESNGKRVTIEGEVLPVDAGEIDFGEPGTNGQHSFYQLLHQGRVVPADFIGFRTSQNPIRLTGKPIEPVSNHDELMANFFAQPDALAMGKTAAECLAEGVPEGLVPHKVFPGNRPSTMLLLERLTPYTCGQLLALYEHRTAVEGFVWGINSFDQWGVELGKVLAKQVRTQLAASRRTKSPIAGFNPSTSAMLTRYLA
ncbi:MAG: glucose-6-phosphate isomerase [Planctomycetes bacterium]|nr:glucose-6-phosphate isomerase [Planctomycetota bacterium]